MPETTTTRPRLPLLTRVLVGPPGWLLIAVAAVVGLLALHHVSLPGGGPLELLFLGVLLAFCTAVVWFARFIVGLLRSDGRPGLRKHWVRWAVAPAMGVAVIALAYADVPFDARFALSEASLERFAQSVASGAKHGDQWVGLYPLTWSEQIDGGARFLVSETGFLDSYGFAWIPNGRPAEESRTEYTHIEGPWYVWENRF